MGYAAAYFERIRNLRVGETVDCPECEWYPDRSRCSLCFGKERVTQERYDQWLSVMQDFSRATSILWQGPDAMRAEEV